MKTEEVDRLINNHFKTGYGSGWYGFKVTCDLHSFGMSNMSPMSKQEYCSRIPKKGRTVDTFGSKKKLVYKKGEKRPTYDPLHCGWRVCPKLKEILKND